MNSDLEHLRKSTKRLELFATRTRQKLWPGTQSNLADALADCAETGEIARRLYQQIHAALLLPPKPPRAPLQDVPR